ncbi:MAG: hypothetical protein ACRC8K_08660 [Waterburya sp.]
MSKIQITELQATNSELNVLNDQDTGAVVGGYGAWGGVKLANIVQINNAINVQVAINGDNFSTQNLNNKAGANQG